MELHTSIVLDKNNCALLFNAIKNQANKSNLLNVEIENMLQKFSSVSLSFKPHC